MNCIQLVRHDQYDGDSIEIYATSLEAGMRYYYQEAQTKLADNHEVLKTYLSKKERWSDDERKISKASKNVYSYSLFISVCDRVIGKWDENTANITISFYPGLSEYLWNTFEVVE